ncbi:endonuclease/exonuclease/phosphatase family protein [Roseibacillus ishigakijimensis]|uniref:Endonuclease/exonuclease/phosphatase family protein n=1 Tax=Roseibacillus ishigakijimensis TaxID=454146 RepID=A0A934VK03_9BACT|nr:endonuclease/exonuclease/phosphatase family protein [Roseibacillus ishigakijimensis]MBK1833149.1 endonuclease/exonuclease/phosphatase family protein [Roseibacillus ishigakijimensis]
MILRVALFSLLTFLCGFVTPGTAGEQEKAAPSGEPQLRVTAYNIRHGAGRDGKVDLDRTAAVLRALDADLIALQEVDKNCRRSGQRDLAAELAQRLGMTHRFGKFMDYQGGEYGMAILSRLPITATTRHPLPRGAEPRCALEVQVTVPGLAQPLSFLSIHNDWTDGEIRTRQVTALLTALAEHRHPVILAGDFNGPRDDASLQLLEKRQWQILPKNDSPAPTFPAHQPEVEIDFLVVKNLPPFTCRHWVEEEEDASDHRPLAASFSWTAR